MPDVYCSEAGFRLDNSVDLIKIQAPRKLRVRWGMQLSVKRFSLFRACLSNVVPVEGLSGFDHFADGAEEAVCDASEGVGVLVTAASQRMAIRSADAVAPDDRRPWPNGRRRS